ncbi:DUF6998 domain-containing protein [Paenibacillus polymyxa]
MKKKEENLEIFEYDPEDIKQIPQLLNELYCIKNTLEKKFKGRKFTLDGHMVGSIGEVVASYIYGITLYGASKKTHDGFLVRENTGEKIEVQVKATQGTKIAISSKPIHLIVLKINTDGTTKEIYNGPGKYAWSKAGAKQKNGQKQISFKILNELMKNKVKDYEKISDIRTQIE